VNRVRDRLAAEHGFTIFEVLAAAFVLVIGLLALLTTFDASRNLTNTADLKNFALGRAQRELEQVQGMQFSSLAMSSIPAASTTASDPTSNIVATASPKTFKWDPRSTTEAQEPLVWVGAGSTTADGATTGGVAPITTVSRAAARAAGGNYGYTVWRFVTRVADPGVACTSDVTKCPRRITVAVQPDGFKNQISPVWLSSIATKFQDG
jgi:Tfp pilus assembly protein PilV